jgi:DNA-binding NtrC family response regulator
MTAHILIIDDEPRWISFAKSELSKFDVFEICVARDAETALVFLEDSRFDVVIVSSRRLDVLQTIIEEHDKPFLVTTTKPTTHEALAAYRSGAARYFAKSFGDRYLFNHVRKFVPRATEA